MNTIVDSPRKIDSKEGPVVFLAGPMSDAPRWHKTVPTLAESIGIDGVTFLSPMKVTRGFASHGTAQMNWETWGLAFADVILFWLPNPAKDNATRVYAQTTRVELGEQLALGRKVILGIDDQITGADYLRYKARQYGIITIHTSLEGCLTELKQMLDAQV